MSNEWKPFGRNILFSPRSKEKIIGDTSKFFLLGEVIAVGEDVTKIKKGDCIGFTQWAVNKIVMPDGQERFFCKENDDFILGVLSNE
jgi:hypothetical protein